jgi:hypothetical protein
MESLSAERQEKVQMLMALTGIEDVDARVILQENDCQLEPDNSWQPVTREDHAAAGTALVHAATAASAASPPSPGASLDAAAAFPAPVAAFPAPTPGREREKDNLSGDEDRDDHQQSAEQISATSAALSPPARGYPIGRNGRGECVYIQGDAVIADTLATYTPRARGMMLLAEKMNNPRLTLSAEESIDVTLAGIQCGLRAKEQMAKGQELLAIVGNTGVGKSLLVNYIHGCKVERVDRVMRVSESSPCTEITTVGHSKQSMTFIPQFAADEDFAYLDCPVSKVCNLRASVHHGSLFALRLLTAYPHLAGLPRQSRPRDQHFQRSQHKEHCHKLERSARDHAHQLQFAQV